MIKIKSAGIIAQNNIDILYNSPHFEFSKKPNVCKAEWNPCFKWVDINRIDRDWLIQWNEEISE